MAVVVYKVIWRNSHTGFPDAAQLQVKGLSGIDSGVPWWQGQIQGVSVKQDFLCYNQSSAAMTHIFYHAFYLRQV